MQNAQIGNFVARLSECIAEASQNKRRNPQYPEIPQLSKRTHMPSFLRYSRAAEMTGDLRQVPLGALTVSLSTQSSEKHGIGVLCDE